MKSRVSYRYLNSRGYMRIDAYQVDDAMGGLLVANEQKTLAGVGGPSDVVLGNLDVLLSLLVGGENFSLDGIGAEEEESLAGDEVPVS